MMSVKRISSRYRGGGGDHRQEIALNCLMMQVITHESFLHHLQQTRNVRSSVTYMRAVRQFGTEIPEETSNPIRVR